MPKIMLIKALAFYIHTKDHQPPHVEVYYGTPERYQAWAKVRIDGRCEVIEADGFHESDLIQIERICQGRVRFLSSKWRKYHGKV